MFGRRRRLPSWARPRLATQERVVAWSPTVPAHGHDERAAVVVTTLGVWLPGHGERLGWHQLHKAAWSAGRLTFTPATRVADGDGYQVMADDSPVVVGLADPGDVPDQVRRRVTASIVLTEHFDLPSGGVRVVGRKVPGVDGLSWQVRYDEGTDAADPDVVRATIEIVAEVAAS